MASRRARWSRLRRTANSTCKVATAEKTLLGAGNCQELTLGLFFIASSILIWMEDKGKAPVSLFHIFGIAACL